MKKNHMIMALFLAIGIGSLTGCGSSNGVPTAYPSREPRTFGSDGPTLTYVVLGDSTAAGQGASSYEHGIAVRTAEGLAKGRRIVMTNLSVSGAQTKDVVADQLEAAVRIRPDMVLLAVGANDVTHLALVSSMRSGLEQIVERLRDANPATIIVITGSPDMSSPPRIPRLLRPLAGRRTRSANQMYRQEVATLHLTFAPIAAETGQQFRDDPTLFAADAFHPNDRGYALWTAVLDRAFASALATR